MRYLLISVMAGFVLSGCSHQAQMVSVERKAAVARTNTDLAKAAVMMRVSDYGQEARYAVSLAPLTPQTKAAMELLDLQHELAGAGKLSPEQRQTLTDSIIRDDLKAHRELYEAAQDDAKLKGEVVTAKEKENAAVEKVNVIANQAATAWDSYHAIVRDLLIAVGLLCAIYFLHVLYTWGVFGAQVAAKVP